MISKRTLDLFTGLWKNREVLDKNVYPPEQAFFNEVFEEITPKSVIVFGCGMGREFNYTDKATLYGVDFTRKFLDETRRDHPEVNLVLAALQALPFRDGTTFDLGLTSVVLQHIPHEDISVVVENIKSVCKAVLLEEDIPITECWFQFNHNYKTLFDPMTLKKMRPAGTANVYAHFLLFVRRETQ